MATQTFASHAAVDAALVALTSAQRASISAAPAPAPAPAGSFVLTYPATLASLIGTGPTVTQLIAYAEAKQGTVLSALQVTHALKDGSATLTTLCDPGSINFLNSLAAWVSLNAMATPAPTRTFYNLDGSAAQVSPADMAEFLSAVGAAVQSTFDAVAKVRSAITSAPPTITTFAQIDTAAWPTAAS